MDYLEDFSEDERLLFTTHDGLPKPTAPVGPTYRPAKPKAAEDETSYFSRLTDFGDLEKLNRPAPDAESDEEILKDWLAYQSRHPKPRIGHFCEIRGIPVRTFHRIRRRAGGSHE